MKALKIKYLKGAFTVFALCLIGTVSAATNGNGDEKEAKKEVKVEKAVQSHQWFIFNGTTPAEESDASMYEPYTGSGEPAGCNGDQLNCAIFAVPNASNPDQPDLTQVDESRTLKQALPGN